MLVFLAGSWSVEPVTTGCWHCLCKSIPMWNCSLKESKFLVVCIGRWYLEYLALLM